MDFDIVIVRVHDGYRVAHGHLHLASALNMSNEAVAYVPGEGNVKVVKTGRGFLAGNDNQWLPVLFTSPTLSRTWIPAVYA